MHVRRLVIPAALVAVALAAAVPAAAQPNQPAPNVPFPANVDYPSGGYGDFNSTVLGKSYVQGVDINVNWSSAEATEGNYTWGPLDTEADAAYNQGKHIILVVRAANETGGATGSTCTPDPAPSQILPSWEISNLQKNVGPNGTYCDGDLETIIPDWFSSQFQNDFLTFIDALGQHVTQQPYYSFISYVRIGVGLGGEAFPVMPNGVGSGCSTSTLPCQSDESADETWMANKWDYSPQSWESFQEYMLSAYDTAFPATADGPAPPLIYAIDKQETIPGHENPVDYEVANWATTTGDTTYNNIGIGQESLPPSTNGLMGLGNYADFDNIVPMVFANNPDVYVQFQTDGVTTTTADEEGIIKAAEGYGAKSIEWYESTWQGTNLAPPDPDDMVNYQTWVNNNCKPTGCPAPSTPGISGYTPSSGMAGTTVTITGQNLANATAVAFDGTPATIESDTATQIVTQVPAGATIGPITVTTAAGTATTPNNFTVTS
jgi:hypothetical protein